MAVSIAEPRRPDSGVYTVDPKCRVVDVPIRCINTKDGTGCDLVCGRAPAVPGRSWAAYCVAGEAGTVATVGAGAAMGFRGIFSFRIAA